jgi:oligoribonuclease
MGVIAGNSVHYDMKFLKIGMPGLFKGLIDPVPIFNVSSVKEVSGAWYKHYQPPEKRLRHRSRDDILESIEEYRYYQQTILKRYSR